MKAMNIILYSYWVLFLGYIGFKALIVTDKWLIFYGLDLGQQVLVCTLSMMPFALLIRYALRNILKEIKCKGEKDSEV